MHLTVLDDNLPSTMAALELHSYREGLQNLALVEKPIPQPGRGEVLVRIDYAAVNPSDLNFLRGEYGKRRPLPTVPGFEGSGVVVAAGPGFMARRMLGKRVAVATQEGQGTWQQYMIMPALRCIALRDEVTTEQGASLFINPLTAYALMSRAKREHRPAVVQTAAASALGRMILRLGQRWSIPVINVVRRQEQVDQLRALGAEHVLNSSDARFDEDLKQVCHELKATLAFDAVGGEMTGRILSAMPQRSCVTVMGNLAGEPCSGLDPDDLVFGAKTLDSFWLTRWIDEQNVLLFLRTIGKVQKLLGTDLETPVRTRLSLEEAVAGIRDYRSRMSAGKILLMPHAHRRQESNGEAERTERVPVLANAG